MNERVLCDPWLVLRTKSRHENIVVGVLQQKQIIAYLPKYKIIRCWQGRKRSVEVPLFPGYVFVRPHANQYEGMRYIRGSCGLIRTADNKPATMSEQGIGAVRALVDSCENLTVDARFVVGKRVKIIAGPLMGVEGELVLVKHQYLLVINVELVGSSVRVEINQDVVEAI